jgi:hypothetical protein
MLLQSYTTIPINDDPSCYSGVNNETRTVLSSSSSSVSIGISLHAIRYLGNIRLHVDAQLRGRYSWNGPVRPDRMCSYATDATHLASQVIRNSHLAYVPVSMTVRRLMVGCETRCLPVTPHRQLSRVSTASSALGVAKQGTPYETGRTRKYGASRF